MQRKGKKICWVSILCVVLFACTACRAEKKEQQTTERTEAVLDGAVQTADSFEQLGMLIDVTASDLVTDVSYEIVNQEIAVVHFTYNGIDCEFRASAVYNDFELAGIENNGDGGIVVASVQGHNATYYTLNPGRVVFWHDDHIYYSLYVYVTAEDSVLDSIFPLLVFEDRYEKRADVVEKKKTSANDFAKQVVTVVQGKDLQTLSEIVNYPLELENGRIVNNKSEFLDLSEADLFTDELLAAVNEAALSDLRAGRDEDSYLIGSSTKNIYFRLTDENTYEIIKINN